MEKTVGYLILITICLSVLMTAGPTFIALIRAAVPLLLALFLGICVLRIVWHYTSRNH